MTSLIEDQNQRVEVLPLISLRDMIIFPGTAKPFIVGRPNSIAAVDCAMKGDRRIFLSLQKDPQAEEPPISELERLGVIAAIIQSMPLPNGQIKLLVESLTRAGVADFLLDGPAWHASVLPQRDLSADDQEVHSLVLQVARLFDEFVQKQQGFQGGVTATSLHPSRPSHFSDQVASHLQVTTEIKQKILRTIDLVDRLQLIKRLLLSEIDKANLDQKLNKEVEKQIEKAQREYYLNEKMKLIRKELGKEDPAAELEELKSKIEKAGMGEAAVEKAMAELKRLELMPAVSAEATVSRSYIDWLLSLPWASESTDKKDIRRSQRILDEDHYGLDKVKERILEFLSVRQLTKTQGGSILCFSGPPGVGKTSVAKSIARSMGRKFVRLSLGGVHDEAEIKGHRRTYIGAFPGQIVQLLKRAGTKNPVFLLDEIDKLGADFRGDPSSALLEVLDPEQNSNFTDHYIDAPFDLGHVFFIATANVTHTIPPALLDRMEIIPFSGYTLPEKIAIAQRHLIPKQIKSHGLRPDEIDFDDESLTFLAQGYTREAGVRNLEREIAAICRKTAHKVVQNRRRGKEKATPEKIEVLLGVPRFRDRQVLHEDEVGAAIGLAWTQNGGETLLIESNLMPGKGRLILTGQMGDVMQESARAALSFIRSESELFGLNERFYAENDVHIHIPEGAIPKDGPSAGVTMACSLLSAFTKIKIRHDVALTGEITLRGKVLPIGGLKEKVLAAKQHEIFHVILPRENEKDLTEVPEVIKEGMNFHFVESILDAVRLLLREDPIRPPSAPPGAMPERPRPGQSR